MCADGATPIERQKLEYRRWLDALALRICRCLTFDMSCMTRLAGACQLDGRVRRHCGPAQPTQGTMTKRQCVWDLHTARIPSDQSSSCIRF